MHQWVDVTTICQAYLSRLDINMQSLPDDIQVNIGANGGGSLTLADMVAICRDQLSGVRLVPIGMISGVSAIRGCPGCCRSAQY